MKKLYLIFFVILVLIAGWILVRFVIGGLEDDWIKDSRGVWIKHGVPSNTPEQVLEQQEAINCALEKFNNFTGEINSQCLGVCGNYAVDIVHVPRTNEDNLVENQCSDFREGKVSHFIELDKNGEIVRIV
ncbi:MAG: hypothetical protein NTZ83_05465 [Candidatus Pacearchaeota archaeon]|nr:hypothetical protein [Candidatus Pacearchaeota archaeon]